MNQARQDVGQKNESVEVPERCAHHDKQVTITIIFVTILATFNKISLVNYVIEEDKLND